MTLSTMPIKKKRSYIENNFTFFLYFKEKLFTRLTGVHAILAPHKTIEIILMDTKNDNPVRLAFEKYKKMVSSM